MDELRMSRREDGALILVNAMGEEYRLIVDDMLVAEVRQLSKRAPSPQSVRPREIQALLRAGKSRAEVAQETGLEEADVERYEEPVRAEQRYMLDLAHSVSVRTDPSREENGEGEQQFGEVIAERLIGLGAKRSEWRSWRDETAGWLIGLEFDSRDGEHDAIWSFDHRKRVLTPLSADATNLSKAGDIGDRLIPTLRAVENERNDRFDSDAFETKDVDPDALLVDDDRDRTTRRPDSENTLYDPNTFEADSQTHPSDEEYERRRDIDHLAVNTPREHEEDLSQTADLLDALRRRRGEREQASSADEGSDDRGAEDRGGSAEAAARGNHPSGTQRTGAAANIWGAAGVSGDGAPPSLRAVESNDGSSHGEPQESPTDDELDKTVPAHTSDAAKQDAKPSKRGRAPIPSWDDILFGTRSDEDPV